MEACASDGTRIIRALSLIHISLPLSEDHSVLRPAHTPGLIAAAVRNSNQGVSCLRFFEPVSYTHLDVYKRQPRSSGSASVSML